MSTLAHRSGAWFCFGVGLAIRASAASVQLVCPRKWLLAVARRGSRRVWLLGTPRRGEIREAAGAGD